MKKNTKKGFTLVELLVVIAILAILASVAVVGYTAFVDKAKDSKAESELHQIAEYVNAEIMDDGEWVIDANTTIAKGNDGKFVEADLVAAIEAQFSDLFDDDRATIELGDDGLTLTYTLTDGGSAKATLR